MSENDGGMKCKVFFVCFEEGRTMPEGQDDLLENPEDFAHNASPVVGQALMPQPNCTPALPHPFQHEIVNPQDIRQFSHSFI